MTTPVARPIEGVLDHIRIDRRSRRVAVGEQVADVGSRDDLRSFLYRVLHTRNATEVTQNHIDSLLPDHELEKTIRTAAVDLGTTTRIRPLRREARAAIIEIDRVRVDVGERTVGDDRLSHSSFRPNLSPGFFFYQCENAPRAVDSPVVRVYAAHDEPRRAVTEWSSMNEALHAAGTSFRSKVLSRRALYPRSDAAVFYLSGVREDLADEIELLGGVRGDVPGATGSLLAAGLGRGLSVADDPRDPRVGRRGESFGQHRAGVIADAVCDHLDTGRPLALFAVEHCRAAGVDPADVSRNTVASGVDS